MRRCTHVQCAGTPGRLDEDWEAQVRAELGISPGDDDTGAPLRTTTEANGAGSDSPTCASNDSWQLLSRGE